MNTYVINLPRDAERKRYMQKILQEQNFKNVVFVEAVYGKSLSAQEKERLFDSAAFTKKYAKLPNDAQIGCTLSHRKCYEEFLQSGEKSCLILEDDIAPKSEMMPVVKKIQQFLESKEEPAIVLLSGWFWYTKKEFFAGNALGSLYSGFLAHSYMLNARGAELLLAQKPYYVADDWYEFRKNFGIKMYGLLSHIINQQWNGNFKSNTDSLSIKYEKGFICAKLALRFKGLAQKMLALIGHYEGVE
ncbi:glycosyltransferase family 25 protein [Treponema brennaborense]|uniref:Glycosyl transferase family 25 n=1 Tax=Treponema brennaborense (strain DSM 12168 / CIP 105900 / DD5/3) TaxID=906968 RepID=F4LIY7_TREBD|nr:glycosyltransferase family 25 protein [Treponema brennaborense]AEE17296.1 glycosyl transferase family 25 [Treponema brennaborense DSM 12168]